ncbi:MAG: hypothetical protein H0U76_04000 [Ktedonobacteraceae bacterium]|nr:hypothetical protein [Ktedonobacteraceae bacterium]
MNDDEPRIDITVGPEAGVYRIFTLYAKDSVAATAHDLLDIAAWVEHHRDQLRKEAGQEITRYRVELRKSNVVRVGSIVELPVDAVNAQEAASRALVQYGARLMAFVTVRSAPKEELFHNVELHPDHSITFDWYREYPRPQPPFAPPFDPDTPRSAN